MILDFIVKGQELSRNGSELIVSDTINYLTAHFRFSGAWEGLTKHAMFEKGTDAYDVTLTDNSIIESDHLNLTDGTWLLSVVGVEITDAVVTQRITTQQIELSVIESGNTSGEPFPPSIGDAVYLNLNQTTPQTIIDGVPLLASDRTINVDNQLADKKYVDDKVATVTADDFNHNDLSNKQGGSSGEYYHMTQAQIAELHAHSNKTALDAVSGTNTGDQDIATPISTHNSASDAHTILARKTETMRLLISRTIGAGENVSAITWTQDDAGTALALSDVMILYYSPANTLSVGSTAVVSLRINNYAGASDYFRGNAFASSLFLATIGTVFGNGQSRLIKQSNGIASGDYTYIRSDGTTNNTTLSRQVLLSAIASIQKIYISISGLTYFPDGTVIEIYGRTA